MRYITNGAVTDPALDERLGSRAHAYAAGTVNHAIADYGLGEKWKGGRGFIGLHFDSGGHCEFCGWG